MILEGTSDCLTSRNNILAVGANGSLRLWDVRSWEMFHESKFPGLTALSLHLMANSKYLTI